MSRGGDGRAAGGEILIKLQVLKNGQLWLIMANYGITEYRMAIRYSVITFSFPSMGMKMCSTPTN